MESSYNGVKEGRKLPVGFLGLVGVVVLWLFIELADFLIFRGGLDKYGIMPRTISGLIGIPLMPFLHGGFRHLFANAFPFLILGYICLKGEKGRFIDATILIVLVGGLGTWLIGRSSYHIGASGLVYGYFGYVMARGIFEKRLKWAVLAIVVGIFFGSMIFGVIPSMASQISWEGHLCGMLVGFWYGRSRANKNKLLSVLE